VLRYLTEIARHGSIRRASQALNIAASAINRQVLRVEQDLGVKLFDRLPDGMRLTPAGEMLLRHVRDTLYNYDRLLADIDSLSGIRSGHVRIVALDSLLVDLLPRVLKSISERYDAISFSVLSASPGAVFHEIAAGRADLGLTFVAPTSNALQLVTSAPAPLGAVMSASHPLAGRKSLSFSDFGNYPVLLQNESLPSTSPLEDEFGAFRGAVRPRLVSNSIEMLRHVVCAGLGIAFFTRLGFLREIAAGDLVWIPIAARPSELLQIGLYIPSQRTLSPAAGMVVNELIRSVEELECLP
jgi:DNA-binding transcriptional LysR family regulator